MVNIFLESLDGIGLSNLQKKAIGDLFTACFETSYHKPLTVPTSVVMSDNIYNAIQKPMGTNSTHSNDMGAYQYPHSKANTPNSMRDYRQEAKDMFAKQVGIKIKKKKTDPNIAEMIKRARSKIPARYPVNAIGHSNMPMATGYSAPNRMNYSPWKQGCEAGGDAGGAQQ